MRLILLLLTILPLFSEDIPPIPNESESNAAKSANEVRQPKKYNLKTKGMKLVEIDEEGDPINNGKRYAIIIGINDYNDIAISDLSKARSDAKAIGKILTEIGQFDQVFVMTDDVDPRMDLNQVYPTKLKIEEKLESLVRFMNPEDMIVFFFSGHGISDPEGNGYLVTVDTVADKKFETALKVDWIIKKLQEKEIKKSLLILDACRDVLYTSKNSARDSIREKNYSEAEVAAVFYSTKTGYYSYEDDESDYGVFTKQMIYGMEGRADENGDGVVSFGELQAFVEKGVKDWSIKKNKQQKPYTKIYGERTGDLAITVASNPKKSLAEKKMEEPSREPEIIRSAIVPGWGQIHRGDKKLGLSYMGMSAIFLAAFFNGYANFTSAKASYEQAKTLNAFVNLSSTQFDPIGVYTYSNTNTQLKQANAAGNEAGIAAMLFIGTYIINIVDAAFLGESSVKTSYFQDPTGWKIYSRPDFLPAVTTVSESPKYFGLGYTFSF